MNLDVLQTYEIGSRDHDFKPSDAILYALGLGYGSDPLDEGQLQFVFEGGLKAVPSICNTIAHPGFWIDRPELGIDFVKVLHAEQSFVIHSTIPPEGRMRGDYAVVSIEDKGADKGAMLRMEKKLSDRDTGELFATVTQTLFMRGDGGQGGFGEVPTPAPAVPDRAPELVSEIATLPQSALIYRLSGDLNPLHASPSIARKAGFDRPILQGLCTMGIAARAVLECVCDQQPDRLKSMSVRFSRPVYPGETIRTEMYRDGSSVSFRCRSVERDLVVLDRGFATVA